MSEDHSYRINPQDKKILRLFIELGIPKNLAKTLLYLSQIDECNSIDIEHETKQRQPEVSLATQELIKKGWIKKRDLRKKRKGRPAQIYKLACTLEEIITKIEKEKTKEIEAVKKDLSALKELIENI